MLDRAITFFNGRRGHAVAECKIRVRTKAVCNLYINRFSCLDRPLILPYHSISKNIKMGVSVKVKQHREFFSPYFYRSL